MKLKRALEAIDDARASLNRVRNEPEARSAILSALSDLEDAESHMKRAIRELPDD
jgi:hypothetical protein